jgi:peroxiredoxin
MVTSGVEGSMDKHLAENRFFAFMLVASILLNIGLTYKLHQEQRSLLNLKGLGFHTYVLGAAVNEIHATDLDGKAATISFAKNDSPAIVYVFRPGCGWCMKNLPNLRAMAASAPARHFRLIGISLDDNGLKQYVESQHFTFPVYSDVAPDERVRLAMGGTPQTLMIANGAIVRDWQGAYTPELQKEIEATLGIKLPGVSANPPVGHS